MIRNSASLRQASKTKPTDAAKLHDGLLDAGFQALTCSTSLAGTNVDSPDSSESVIMISRDELDSDVRKSVYGAVRDLIDRGELTSSGSPKRDVIDSIRNINYVVLLIELTIYIIYEKALKKGVKAVYRAAKTQCGALCPMAQKSHKKAAAPEEGQSSKRKRRPVQ